MNNTLTDGLRLLKALAESGESKSVKELAESFQWPPSHACRLLKTLVDSGYIEQDSKRQYRVGLKILTLSNAILQRMEMRKRLRPFIEKLAKCTGRHVHLSALAEWMPIVVDVAYPDSSAHDPGLSIGAVNPIHVSAGGKISAAFHPLEGLDEFLDKVEFKRFTARTITSKEEFKKQLERIRESKIAVAMDERGERSGAIGAPVFNADGSLAGAIGIVLDRILKETELAKLSETLAETADAASYALGYPHWRAHKQ